MARPRAADPAQPEDGLIIPHVGHDRDAEGRAHQPARHDRPRLARARRLRLSADASFLAWAPMFHMVSTDSVGMLMNGGTVIVMDGLKPGEFVEWTTRARISHLIVMPGMIDQIIAEMRATNARPQPISAIGCMADLVPRHQIAEITTLMNAPIAIHSARRRPASRRPAGI